MKKKWFGLANFAFLLSAVGLVSAENEVGIALQSFAQGISEYMNSIWVNPHTATVFLLGLLLWVILFSIIKQIFNYEGGYWNNLIPTVISLIIVFLTFRFIPPELIEAIALQYTAMGATLLTVIPFLIILYFTMVANQNLLLARITWLFYIVYYGLIFLYKIGVSGKSWYSAHNLPYLGALIAGIAVFVGIKYFRNLIFKGKLEAQKEASEKDTDEFVAATKEMKRLTKGITGIGKKVK